MNFYELWNGRPQTLNLDNSRYSEDNDKLLSFIAVSNCPECFDTVGWASGRAPNLYKLSDEVLVWLSVWSEVQIVCMWSSWCHCIPKRYRLLPHLNPDWFYLSGAGLPRMSWKHRPLNGCSSSGVWELIAEWQTGGRCIPQWDGQVARSWGAWS